MKIKFIFLFIVSVVIYSCSSPVPRKPILRKTGNSMDASVELNKKLNALEEENIKYFIKNDTLISYTSTPYGFWYAVNSTMEKSNKPSFGDIVQYTYEISNLNNEIIYTFDEIGLKSYQVEQQELQEEGLREGLKMMSEGDQYTFLFPSHKTFGYSGDGERIGMNETLIYKVKLIKINKKNEN